MSLLYSCFGVSRLFVSSTIGIKITITITEKADPARFATPAARRHDLAVGDWRLS